MHSNNDCHSCNTTLIKKPRHQSQGLIFSLLIVSICHFIFASTYTNYQLDIKTSTLIVKRDGCEFLSEYAIPTQPHGIDECRVTVPFETNMFGTAGKIHIGDQQIRMAENQVTLVGTTEDHAWTPQRRWLISWLGISVAIMLGLLMLMVRALL